MGGLCLQAPFLFHKVISKLYLFVLKIRIVRIIFFAKNTYFVYNIEGRQGGHDSGKNSERKK